MCVCVRQCFEQFSYFVFFCITLLNILKTNSIVPSISYSRAFGAVFVSYMIYNCVSEITVSHRYRVANHIELY